ncbi:hypothetical protein F5Y16DRAFT_397132 [Xylariaceae sp. FL0255]|nr:hypothetical protein F5Y16DRAFT_397132 [Xylariaceae sp. FL0255]
MSTEKLIRITSLISRKKGMTQEDAQASSCNVKRVADFRQAPLWPHSMCLIKHVNDLIDDGMAQFHTRPETNALDDNFAEATGRPDK